MGGKAELKGPNLEIEGMKAADLADGAMLEGHAGGESVLVIRRGTELFAIGAHCTHYGAPLADGLLTGHEVRCPWHHACFDRRSGQARAPALNPVACWNVQQKGDRIFVSGKKAEAPARKLTTKTPPQRVVIVGAGAAGSSAAETLRREGFTGEVHLVGTDPSVPVDRPNLSKDYLAGNAPEEWMPLRSAAFYAEQQIQLLLGTTASAIDTDARTVSLSNGQSLSYDALLLATGADPTRLPIPGSELPHVYTLRSMADCKAIIARVSAAKRAVVIGASFIGLEVAASLKTRGLEVDVVAPDAQPLAKVLGDVGAFIRTVHEEKGVQFHLGHKPAAITANSVTLDDGTQLPCDFVVMGVGVRPAVALAQGTGLTVDNGVLTDMFLETHAPGVFAAGDIARYATADGKRRRVEHWAHAQKQGQVAAQNILGLGRAFNHVPFFWSAHYELTLNYVGYAEAWDAMHISGSLERRDATVVYREAGAIRAVATIGRDTVSLKAEEAFENGDVAALESLAG